MYSPISKVFEGIPDNFDNKSYLKTMVADRNMSIDFGGISVDSSIISRLRYSGDGDADLYKRFEVSKYSHLIDHFRINTLGWLTDLALGFEKETKSSLLTVVTHRFYVKNIKDVNSVINNQETIGAYIFMFAYLNALTNGEFNYKAFLEDVKFLTGEILSKFPESDGVKREFGNANYVISKALTNSIDFYHRFKISEGGVSTDPTNPAFTYKNSKGEEFTAIDTHLMRILLDLGCFTCNEKAIAENNYSVITEKDQLEFNLDKIGDNLEEILKYLVEKALELEKDQRQERLNAYEEIRSNLGKEGFADFLKRLTAERVKPQPPPSEIINSYDVTNKATKKISV
jgi:hypothetical protein